MLQASPHVIHFKSILNFGEGQPAPLSFGRFGVGPPSRPLRSVTVRGDERASASDADVPIPFSFRVFIWHTIPVNESKSSPPFSETLGATCAQPAYLSTNRGMLVSKGSRINVNFADYWIIGRGGGDRKQQHEEFQ